MGSHQVWSEPLTAAVSTPLLLALILTLTTKHVSDKPTLIPSTVYHTIFATLPLSFPQLHPHSVPHSLIQGQATVWQFITAAGALGKGTCANEPVLCVNHIPLLLTSCNLSFRLSKTTIGCYIGGYRVLDYSGSGQFH